MITGTLPVQIDVLSYTSKNAFLVSSYNLTPVAPAAFIADVAISSILPGVSEEIPIGLRTHAGQVQTVKVSDVTLMNGILQQFKIACESTNYSISLRSKKNVVNPDLSSDVVLQVVEIVNYYDETEMNIFFSNNDPQNTSQLYLVITNYDTTNQIVNVNLEITCTSMHQNIPL